MKKYSLIVFIVFVAQSIINIQGQEYHYPTLPGSTEWQNLSTHQQKITVCQIPQQVLQNIPTIDLIQTCLNYPLLIDCYAYGSIHEGVERCIKDFNGLAELIQRTDAFEKLLLYLENSITESTSYNLSDTISVGNRIIKTSIIEVLLSQKQVTSYGEISQIDHAIDLVYQSFMHKINSNIYSNYAISSAAYTLLLLIKDSINDEFISNSLQSLLTSKILSSKQEEGMLIRAYQLYQSNREIKK